MLTLAIDKKPTEWFLLQLSSTPRIDTYGPDPYHQIDEASAALRMTPHSARRWFQEQAFPIPPCLENLPSTEATVEFPHPALAIVKEDTTCVSVKGERNVSVFRRVVEAAGGFVSWVSLRDADLGQASEMLKKKLDFRGKKYADSPTPRIATRTDTLQRAGNRIKKSLGKLSYHWQQNGTGASWDPQVK